VTTNGTTVDFGYDGLGRRVRKTVSGVTTGYLYAGADLLMELDGNGNASTEYAYWPSVDAPFAMSKGGQTYYFAQDPTGNNITGLIRASDNSVQASYAYTPFGAQRSGTFDNVGNSLQFAARQYDSTTKLLYFRARYYDPQVGRFISEDPLGLGGGINPYVYAGNDPVNGSDPLGLDGNDGCPEGWHREVVTVEKRIVNDECFLNGGASVGPPAPSDRGTSAPRGGATAPAGGTGGSRSTPRRGTTQGETTPGPHDRWTACVADQSLNGAIKGAVLFGLAGAREGLLVAPFWGRRTAVISDIVVSLSGSPELVPVITEPATLVGEAAAILYYGGMGAYKGAKAGAALQGIAYGAVLKCGN
jgi:RHS repeat-associated protein